MNVQRSYLHRRCLDKTGEQLAQEALEEVSIFAPAKKTRTDMERKNAGMYLTEP